MKFFQRRASVICITDSASECSKSDLATSKVRGKRALSSSVNKSKKAPVNLDLIPMPQSMSLKLGIDLILVKLKMLAVTKSHVILL